MGSLGDDNNGVESNDIADLIWGNSSAIDEVYWDNEIDNMEPNTLGASNDDKKQLNDFFQSKEGRAAAIQYIQSGKPLLNVIKDINPAFKNRLNREGMVKRYEDENSQFGFGYCEFDPEAALKGSGTIVQIFLAPCAFTVPDFLGTVLYHEIQHAYDVYTGTYSNIMNKYGKDLGEKIFEKRAQTKGYHYYGGVAGYNNHDFYSTSIYGAYRRYKFYPDYP